MCFYRRQHHGKGLIRILSRLAVLALVCMVLTGVGLRPHPFAQARTAAAPPGPAAIESYYGQSDSEALRAMPALELDLLVQADPVQPPPPVRFRAIPPGLKLPGGPAALPELFQLVGARELPATLLLSSGDWFGARLRRAAAGLGLKLDAEQLRALEALAASRAVNTRLLLTLAAIKQAPQTYATEQDWLKWLYLETSRLRAALGPFAADQVEVIRFSAGASASLRPAQTNTALRALATSLGAGKTAQETRHLLAEFSRRYTAAFGAPSSAERQAAAGAPFLAKPFTVPLTGRGYYDHTYPSVDTADDQPNVEGMLDYLGRSTTSYDTHDGDDFWMPYGSEIRSPVSGTVLWTYDNGSEKMLLIGYGPSAEYHIVIAHLSEMQPLSYGSSVTQGQLIGKSGKPTGGSLEHIHFEVRHNGKQTDSMGWYGGGSDPCPGGPGPGGAYKGCEASVWLWAEPPCNDAVEVGIWSSRQWVLQEAYQRNGGYHSLGCVRTGTYVWGTGGNQVVRQDFSGPLLADDTAIIHDEQRDQPPGSTPAYVLRGAIWRHYQSLGGPDSWLGPPTSDQFTNTAGQPQSNFRSGYIVWDGAAARAYAWSVPGDAWRAEYHNGRNLDNYPSWVQGQTTVSHAWGQCAPGAGRWGVWPDNFSARYSGRFSFSAGRYNFVAGADDGIRLYVDDMLVIDQWQDQAYTEYRASLNLNAGEHKVVAEYYENGGGAKVLVRWAPASEIAVKSRAFLPFVQSSTGGGLPGC